MLPRVFRPKKGNKLELWMCAPADDDIPYFAELSVTKDGAHYGLAEVHLENVNVSAVGLERVEHARVVIRFWVEDAYFDFAYADVLETLDRARTRLLVGESYVPPDA